MTDGVQYKLWDVSSSGNSSDNSLCAITIATPCPICSWHSDGPAIRLGHADWAVNPHACTYCYKGHARALRHADKSVRTCNSHPPTHFISIYQFINCSELRTREGQLKMHWELEKRASTQFSQGELKQRSRGQWDRETERQTGKI